MLYYFLDGLKDLPGFGVFQYITFRAMLSIITSLVISLLIGKKIIDVLRRNQIGEVVRDSAEGPDHASKAGTPTMGGLIIIAATLIPTLFWGDLKNGYVWLILLGTAWMGFIGFVDDYIKVFRKDKRGLQGKFKVVGQVGLGLIVGLTMLFHPDFMGSRAHLTQLNRLKTSPLLERVGFQQGDELTRVNGNEYTAAPSGDTYPDIAMYAVNRTMPNGQTAEKIIPIQKGQREAIAKELFGPKDKTFIYTTDFPFFKDYVFDYGNIPVLREWISPDLLGRIIYLLVVIFIITAVSNGVNLTDGIDGLAAGTTAIVGAALGVFAYVSGNYVFSNYLHISYIPLSAELLIYTAALVGGCLGFLWYNSFPAQVFMGDTGSLALGGAVGILALMVKKELLLPIFCGIFFAESLSVILQVTYFKYTKKKYGEGRRIFRMAPLHHHYEKSGIHEAKISMRFFLVAIMLVVLAFATLKLR
ncbi:phospho-N-acetylmuramoyl-pentapeptide-transferase [Pontibacter sp. G13]|uniref:phospho-N-acetylmuramoyl-pentapeptide- transferase n=1 Tax=Pontibacter sp. G13 TaxID=3074898 RepID=UPI00288B4405|nr:phospho-N-acetylmuramoyl-pentapeptide-transferase [Pontibacter sp. G13]WNJ20257.1 phospho-N-acetylmuramoyl-pentapeptide-transferase [Pontibacter sp. G13]